MLLSVEFLKELLDLARNVVETERVVPPIEEEERGKQALTELFEEAKTDDTPIIVDRVVADIDDDRSRRSLRRLASDPRRRARSEDGASQDAVQVQAPSGSDLFDRAYGYIREYY